MNEIIKDKSAKINWLIDQIDLIIDRAKKCESEHEASLSKVHSKFELNARNLVHYRALRTLDLRDLQKRLGNMGLSRFSGDEGHVMANLLATRSILESMVGKEPLKIQKADLSFKKSYQLERSVAKNLLGYRSKGRRTRIMVTLPAVAAEDYQMVHDMIESGMNCARINCAHDDPEVWGKLVDHVRIASKALKRKCKVAMDLGGPKIRTGALIPGPKIKKFRPKRNLRGEVIEPFMLWLGEEASDDNSLEHLPVIWKNFEALFPGEQLYFRDARKKKRKFSIVKILDHGCEIHGTKTAYLETGMKIYSDSKRASPPIVVAEILPIEQPISLHKGDMLHIIRENIPGQGADKDNKKPAFISCTLPDIVNQVQPGEQIFFDDGKIEGVIQEVNAKEAVVEIVHAKAGGGKLKSDKGINLPTSKLTVSGLTAKDRKDLEFVVEHADVVNLSFVNSTQDVRDLFTALKELKAPSNLGIILKIETQSGFNNLTEILLEAMQTYPLGVMIARGDLAIECGWKNIARVQEEMLNLCQAAIVPDVWATQVLESLSKLGTPSRAEITDASTAQRAEAVMLNKGPYILQSIQLLDTIFKDLAPHQKKNVPLLPKLEKADNQKKVEDVDNPKINP